MSGISEAEQQIRTNISSRLRRMLEAFEGSEVSSDAWACRLLGEPWILAGIASFFVPEFANIPLCKIIRCIVGTIDIDAMPLDANDLEPDVHNMLHPSLLNAGTSSKSQSDGAVFLM